TTVAATPTTSDLGTPKAAPSGTPLKVGYMTDGKTTNIDDSTEVPAAQAAVKYINGYLGGIDGHPLSLDVCDDQQTPSGATDCANQFATDKVPVVLYNVSGEGGPLFTGLKTAGIPLFAYASIDQGTLQGSAATTFVVTNGLASAFAGPAKVGEDAGIKHAAEVVTDVPSASSPAKALDPILYKNAGMTVDVVVIPVAEADPTPQIQAELSKSPGEFHVLGAVGLCTPTLKALKSLGFTGTIVVIPQCIDATSASAIPGGYTGVKMLTASTNDPTDPDNKVYIAAMKAFASGTDPFANGVTQGGFAAVLGFARAMTGTTGDFSTTGVAATIASMSPQPMPFGAGVMFQCNGKQVTITPPVCSTAVLETTLNQAGLPTGGFTQVDTSALLKLG
ncbi:MAG TPA: ABC transporter substrate-binding protein, partial [Acidimicrobiales bacterium]|nr:ABC transporter substrate-binding protein [Acidimicrobiales bacterium]